MSLHKRTVPNIERGAGQVFIPPTTQCANNIFADCSVNSVSFVVLFYYYMYFNDVLIFRNAPVFKSQRMVVHRQLMIAMLLAIMILAISDFVEKNSVSFKDHLPRISTSK